MNIYILNEDHNSYTNKYGITYVKTKVDGVDSLMLEAGGELIADKISMMYEQVKHISNFYDVLNFHTDDGDVYFEVHLKGIQQISEDEHEDWDDFITVKNGKEVI